MNTGIGIEFMLPNEAWRTNGDGTEVLGSLLKKLTPYKEVSLSVNVLGQLVDRSTCFLVASDLAHDRHGHIVGIARLVVHHSDTTRFGEIHDLVVATSHEGQGVGKALIRKALAVAIDLKLPFVEVAIKPKSERVHADKMFRSLGFQLIATADPAVVDSANRYQLELTKPRVRSTHA